MSTERLYDTIVVGAGLSGLSAAQQLLLAGRDVLVLEATHRAGGKIQSELVDGMPLDLGAQWIRPGYEKVLELIQLLGLQVVEKTWEGNDFYFARGVKRYFDGPVPNLKVTDRLNAARLLNHLSKIRIPDPAKPWLIPEANELDRQRFGHYIRQKTYSTGYQRMVRDIIESKFLNGLIQGSALQGINHWHACSSKAKWTICGGMEQLIRKLTMEVDIHYQRPVSSVTRMGGILDIKTPTRDYRCRSVIIALPPSQAASIHYHPAVSASRQGFWKSFETGRIIQSVMIFAQPLAKDIGWSGQGYLSEEYAFNSVTDVSPRDQPQVVLTTFTVGARCLPLESLSASEKEQVILNQVKTLFNLPADLEVRKFIMKDWKTPPNGPGAYHILPPGTLTTYGDYIDRSEGQIHWASAEYDPVFRGTLEGAVRSGRKAADAILGI